MYVLKYEDGSVHVYDGRVFSVAVGLVGVLGWLLGGRGVSHAALGQ